MAEKKPLNPEAKKKLEAGLINQDQAERYDEIVAAIEEDAKVPPVDMKAERRKRLYDNARSKGN